MMPRCSSSSTALPIRDRVERNGKIELRASTPRSAHVIATRSESPASWNSGAVGFSDVELDVAIGQNEHASAFDAAVNAPRHLQNLVGAEVHSGEHVLVRAR